jgi:hypothetical protein
MTAGYVALRAPGGEPLELAPAARGFELRAAGAVAAVIQREGSGGSDAVARSADGEWRFAGGWLGGRVGVTDVASGERVAMIRQRGVTGTRGRVSIGDRELDYRSTGTSATRWELLDHGTVFVDVAGVSATEERFTVTLSEPAPESLLVLIACYGAMQSSAAAAASAAM